MTFCDQTLIGSKVVKCVEALLAKGGEWHENRVVWAGDCSHPDRDLYHMIPDDEEPILVPANLYQMCDRTEWFWKVEIEAREDGHYRFILNHDANRYVDLEKAMRGTKYHPLALLTVDTTGSGVGDYRPGEDAFDSSLLGAWTRQRISVQHVRPTGSFTELKIVPSWTFVGSAILLRSLVQTGRAAPWVFPLFSEEEKVLQAAFVDCEESIFRKILSFLV